MCEQSAIETEPCVGCATPLPELPPYAVTAVGPYGYDGITDDGERVCTDCWCARCRQHHTDDAQHDACGLPPLDRNDPEFRCDPDTAYAAATGR